MKTNPSELKITIKRIREEAHEVYEMYKETKSRNHAITRELVKCQNALRRINKHAMDVGDAMDLSQNYDRGYHKGKEALEKIWDISTIAIPHPTAAQVREKLKEILAEKNKQGEK